MEPSQLHPVQVEIVKFLFKKNNEFITSERIALQCSVSSKTVRKYLKSLNEFIKYYDAVIEMKRGKGYRLKINNNSRFYELLLSFKETGYFSEKPFSFEEKSERERYILNAILLENKRLTISYLSEALFLSKSAVTSIIQNIKKYLEEYELVLNYDLGGYIKIHGNEINKRKFILNYFFSSLTENQYLKNNLIKFDREGFSEQTIFIIVLENCREHDIQLSDFTLQNLVLHIALAIKRIEKGFPISNLAVDGFIDFAKELEVAKKIMSKIEQITGFNFSENEALYIALQLKSKSSNSKDEFEEIDFSLRDQIENALNNIKIVSSVGFIIDSSLINGIYSHFKSLLTRMKLNIDLDNPVLNEVIENYEEVFILTERYFNKLPIISNYDLSNDEVAYLALHILAAVERYKRNNKLNVIVICATGLGSAQMLKNRLENTFSSNFNIKDVISYYQLNDKILRDIDLIISTIDITTSFYNIPVVKVSVFLSSSDIKKLQQTIESFIVLKENSNSNTNKTDYGEDLFYQYFDKKRFLVFNSNITRKNVLTKMIECLTDAKKDEKFKENLLNQITIREQFGSIVFNPLVAFPHPNQPVGINSEIVIGVIPDGLYWDATYKEVRLIILMSPSQIENIGLEKINQTLAEYISEDSNIEALLNDCSFERFKTIIMDLINSN